MEARPAPTPEHRVTWHPPNVPLTASSNERVALLGRRCARDQCCLSGPHEAGKLVAGIIGAGDGSRTRRRRTELGVVMSDFRRPRNCCEVADGVSFEKPTAASLAQRLAETVQNRQ
jgi:hypothetical protein